jgi:hypothetical protein
MGAFHFPWGLLVAVFLLAALATLIAAIAKRGGAGTFDFPYQPAIALFSPAERSFLGVLDQAVGSEHRVFGKVRVADVAMVKSGLGNSARRGALNRIASKHFDFVVCRANDLSILCAVELNDKSHASQRAQARDSLVAGVCQIIKLPLLTVAAKPAYSAQELRAQFMAAISPSFAPSVGT